MRMSETCEQLYGALAAARANFGVAARTKTAKIAGKTKTGESFNYTYKYAPLEECFGAVDKALSDQGLALIGGVEYSEDGHLWVLTRLAHVSGQWIENALDVGVPQSLKDVGGNLTYARRYGVMLTVQMQAEDDDDAQRTDETFEEPVIDRRPARKSAPRPTEPVQTPSDVIGDAKATKEEPTKTAVMKLFQRMQEVYGDASVVTGLIRAVVQPAGETWSDFRVRNTITGVHFQQLTADTERDATQKAAETNGTPPDDDVPLTSGPVASDELISQTSSTGEQGESLATGETHQEPSSAADEPPAEESPERIALRTEAEGWGIPAAEVQHILSHHAMATARTLLWKARQQRLQTTTSEV